MPWRAPFGSFFHLYFLLFNFWEFVPLDCDRFFIVFLFILFIIQLLIILSFAFSIIQLLRILALTGSIASATLSWIFVTGFDSRSCAHHIMIMCIHVCTCIHVCIQTLYIIVRTCIYTWATYHVCDVYMYTYIRYISYMYQNSIHVLIS